jgi:hypothetical protein
MSVERPFFIKCKVVEVSPWHPLVIVKGINGNVYHIRNDTPGIKFEDIELDMIIEIEITSRLTRVWSTRKITDAAECDGSTSGL